MIIIIGFFLSVYLIEAAQGLEKIALNTPQEGKIYGYVRWIKRTEGGSSLHIFIPQKI
jgi:hypothetical protein